MVMEHVLSRSSSRKHQRRGVSILTSNLNADTAFIFEGEVLTRYLLECFNDPNASARQLIVLDENSVTIYSGPTHSNNGNYSVPVDIELDGNYTVRIALSGGASAGTFATGGVDYLTLFVR